MTGGVIFVVNRFLAVKIYDNERKTKHPKGRRKKKFFLEKKYCSFRPKTVGKKIVKIHFWLF